MREQESKPVPDLAIAVDWSEAAAAPITHVNQFIGQPGPPTLEGKPDGVYLLLGSVPPPLIPADPEGNRRAVEALKATGIRVTVHGRFHLSRERLEELILVLQQTADNYDMVVSRAAQPASEQHEEESA